MSSVRKFSQSKRYSPTTCSISRRRIGGYVYWLSSDGVRKQETMAFSENQNQLRKHGSVVLGRDQQDLDRPLQSIAVWATVNTWAADYGEQTLGDRYLQVRFEDLCSDPGTTSRRVFDFFELEGDAEGMAEAAVRPPSTLGRWRDEKSDTVRGLHDVAGPALARFGYL